MPADGIQHSQGGKVNNRLKLKGQVCPSGLKGHAGAFNGRDYCKKMLCGRKMRELGFRRKLKFSDKFCQIFPGRITLPIFLKIQRSLVNETIRDFSALNG